MGDGMTEVSVLFVCLGNICRSPTAEGVFRHLVEERGLGDRITIDSAGTAAYHAGESPDRRATATAKGRGVTLDGAARKVQKRDFDDFDYILAMDASNHEDLVRISPASARGKIHLFRDFDARSPRGSEVPDPYYGGESGFAAVFDICMAASEGLLAHLSEAH
jgi:protein-tyrosine phosphatase